MKLTRACIPLLILLGACNRQPLCATDSDCLEGQRCDGTGHCAVGQKLCAGDSECLEGQRCDDTGQCVVRQCSTIITNIPSQVLVSFPFSAHVEIEEADGTASLSDEQVPLQLGVGAGSAALEPEGVQAYLNQGSTTVDGLRVTGAGTGVTLRSGGRCPGESAPFDVVLPSAADGVGHLVAGNTMDLQASHSPDGGFPPNNATLSNPTDVVVDHENRRMFVADNHFDRVLIFPLDSEGLLVNTTRRAATVVGQENLDAWVDVTAQNRLSAPAAVALDLSPAGDRLFVADADNNRVLLFSEPFMDDMNADIVLGRADFITHMTAEDGKELEHPNGLAVDSVGSRLFVADTWNHRVLVYNIETNALFDGVAPIGVLGQTALEGATHINPRDDAHGMNEPSGLAYDPVNNRLFVADSLHNRVLIYDVTDITAAQPEEDGRDAVAVLGQPTFGSFAEGGGRAGLNWPTGVSYDAVHGLLWVSDTGNCRLLAFDVETVTNGQAAKHVVGQPDFDSVTCAEPADAQNFYNVYQAVHDGARNRLWVVEGTPRDRVLQFDLPLP